MEEEIKSLRIVTRPITEVKDHEAQIEADIAVVGETQHIDIDEWDGAKEVEMKTIQNFLIHKIGALQILS